MIDILKKMVENQKNGKSFVLATVVEGAEKSPGRSGFKMISYLDGTSEGTVGGGELEKLVLEKLKPKEIDDKLFSSYLYAPDIPDPNLMIRTSGEFRISNFLLWQLSYSELWITDTLWPDFNEELFAEAINSYKNRNRRFGGVNV